MQKATFSLFSRSNPVRKVGTVSFFGKSYKAAQTAGERYLRKLGLGRNIAGGFYDATGFHPVRWSKDYSGKEHGEKAKRGWMSPEEWRAGRAAGRARKKMRASRR